MKLRRVGAPEVSPDGKWVIFSVVDVDLAANGKTPHIWIVPAAGGAYADVSWLKCNTKSCSFRPRIPGSLPNPRAHRLSLITTASAKP
ncbi:MAG: hypothetical protein ACLPHI_21905 [Terriglobales bacterium]